MKSITGINQKEWKQSSFFLKDDDIHTYLTYADDSLSINKNHFKWHLKITIRTFLNLRSLKSLENKIQNDIEYKLKNILNSKCEFIPAAKISYRNYRVLHWYLSCPKIDFHKGKKIVDDIKRYNEIKFEINEDPKWNGIEMFHKKQLIELNA